MFKNSLQSTYIGSNNIVKGKQVKEWVICYYDVNRVQRITYSFAGIKHLIKYMNHKLIFKKIDEKKTQTSKNIKWFLSKYYTSRNMKMVQQLQNIIPFFNLARRLIWNKIYLR